jgi:ectoine hydroxylase
MNILTAAQKASYEADGFLGLPGLVDAEWLQRLNAATTRAVEESRGITETSEWLDVEEDHTPETPRLRRLIKPQDYDPTFWEFASQGPFVDLAEDLLGPNIKFHHGKLNFKWSDGGAEVKWHQDIPFWPHTSYNVLTLGVALDAIDDEMGPMGVLPGSHRGPIFDHYATDGRWQGFISDPDTATLTLDSAGYLQGPAGTVTIHHCRAVHGSRPNRHPSKPRPLLLFAYSNAASLPIMPYNQDSIHNGAIVRGKHPGFPEIDPEPCPLPPLRSGPYRSIFASQQGEDAAGRM